MSEELKTAIAAAKKGAEKALEYFNTSLKVEFKEDKSPITIADKETEEVIKSFITAKYPDAAFLAEESGGSRKEKIMWIIDPIDGTRSFSRGLPSWCILIALYRNGKIVCGVSYFPALDKMLYAEENYGAYCNDEKIHVSEISSLQKAIISFGGLKHFKNRQIILDLIEGSVATRSMDEAILFVATGNMDGFIDNYAQTWDVAPYISIIQEAGGKITNLKGEKWTLADRGYIASNGLLHDEIVRIVNK